MPNFVTFRIFPILFHLFVIRISISILVIPRLDHIGNYILYHPCLILFNQLLTKTFEILGQTKKKGNEWAQFILFMY
ncbi:hypothetical protein HanIR_Chr04g0169621 [Helianthus annuus]|nr:hypothetical protein HanIR_Chr04g0169621 [Helianthus annuus]